MAHPSRIGYQRGVAAVELACLLPIFLTILFGIVELSFALYDKAVITNASREAARAGIVFTSPRRTTAQITNVALSYTSNQLISFGSKVAPAVTVDQSAGTAAGSPLSVTVSYTYTGIVLAGFMANVGAPITFRATTVMNYE